MTLNSLALLLRSELSAAPQFVKFVLIAGFATLINLVSRALMTPAVGFEASVPVAYLIGMGVGYALFRKYVFSRSGSTIAAETTRFIMVSTVAFFIVWSVSVLLARKILPGVGWTWHAEEVAHIVSVALPMITSYIGHKRFTFRERRQIR